MSSLLRTNIRAVKIARRNKELIKERVRQVVDLKGCSKRAVVVQVQISPDAQFCDEIMIILLLIFYIYS